jgi:hypothetical protein
MSGTAWAQATSMTQQPAQVGPKRIFVGATGGVTLGNTTGGAFGGEVGFRFGDSVEFFGEGGRMTDVTTSDTEGAAQAVVDYLNTLGQGTASYSAETPVNYGAVGLRYLFLAGPTEPYVAVSVGVANVERNTAFSLNGSDVTGQLPSLGVALGEDLSGRTNNLLTTVGGGVRIPLGSVIVDVGARYGRIFTDPGIDTFRVYAGVGFAF